MWNFPFFFFFDGFPKSPVIMVPSFDSIGENSQEKVFNETKNVQTTHIKNPLFWGKEKILFIFVE